jgi:hypothetical protein
MYKTPGGDGPDAIEAGQPTRRAENLGLEGREAAPGRLDQALYERLQTGGRLLYTMPRPVAAMSANVTGDHRFPCRSTRSRSWTKCVATFLIGVGRGVRVVFSDTEVQQRLSP